MLSEEEVPLTEQERFEMVMEALTFISIQLTRLYDASMANIRDGKSQYDLMAKHKQGDTNSPPPIFKEELWQ